MLKRLQSFAHAFRGIAAAFRSEPNLRIHVMATVCAIALGALLGLSVMEWCAVLSAIALVLVAELLNTAIERLTDLASPEDHPLAAASKDIAAAAVLIAAIYAAVAGLLILTPKIWARVVSVI